VSDDRIPQKADLDSLIATLEVNVVALVECLVSPGWSLSFPAVGVPAIHYTLKGRGQMVLGDGTKITLVPHAMVIMPPGQSFRIDAIVDGEKLPTLRVKEARILSLVAPETMQTFVAGEDEPQLLTICGYFRASYGTTIDLFATLRSPIVEQFDALDHLAHNLQSVLAELAARQVGMLAMTTSLLKQVFVVLLRRSLKSADAWMERFSMLSDPQITRAFADMVAMPGAPHSLLTLSQAAGLSRSAFMARFLRCLGQPPMVVLRQLRMRQAANLLTANVLSVEQVARAVGYTSRSSFSRAFRQAYGNEPAAHRAATEQPPVHLSEKDRDANMALLNSK